MCNIPPSRNWQSGNQPGRLNTTTVSIMAFHSVHEQVSGREEACVVGSGEQKRVALPVVRWARRGKLEGVAEPIPLILITSRMAMDFVV